MVPTIFPRENPSKRVAAGAGVKAKGAYLLHRGHEEGVHAWIAAGTWTCVDASSKSGKGFPTLMKGAKLEFRGNQLQIRGGGGKETHLYRMKRVTKSVNEAADLY
jgi:hypothetical protein